MVRNVSKIGVGVPGVGEASGVVWYMAMRSLMVRGFTSSSSSRLSPATLPRLNVVLAKEVFVPRFWNGAVDELGVGVERRGWEGRVAPARRWLGEGWSRSGRSSGLASRSVGGWAAPRSGERIPARLDCF